MEPMYGAFLAVKASDLMDYWAAWERANAWTAYSYDMPGTRSAHVSP